MKLLYSEQIPLRNGKQRGHSGRGDRFGFHFPSFLCQVEGLRGEIRKSYLQRHFSHTILHGFKISGKKSVWIMINRND